MAQHHQQQRRGQDCIWTHEKCEEKNEMQVKVIKTIGEEALEPAPSLDWRRQTPNLLLWWSLYCIRWPWTLSVMLLWAQTAAGLHVIHRALLFHSTPHMFIYHCSVSLNLDHSLHKSVFCLVSQCSFSLSLLRGEITILQLINSEQSNSSQLYCGAVSCTCTPIITLLKLLRPVGIYPWWGKMEFLLWSGIWILL